MNKKSVKKQDPTFYALRSTLYAAKGFSLIEIVITIAIFLILSGGIYATYANILEVIGKTHLRTLAVSLLTKEIEYVRNLKYDDVGIIGGAPAGVIPQTKTVNYEGQQFTIAAYVRNIDDSFDGTLGGSPNDTAPADYRLVELQVSCPSCYNFVTQTMTTWAAPQNLESSTKNGSLFINVFDSNGNPVSGANVLVKNTSTTPTITITDTTNNSGTLQLVDIPTSTNAYQITITKPNYSSAKTYPPGGAGNTNPVQPHATIASQQITAISFGIDKVSEIDVTTRDQYCAAVGSIDFTQNGGKLIGASPDVLKYSQAFTTNSSGVANRTGLEWDNYSFSNTDTSYDVAGSIPLLPISLPANTTTSLSFLMEPKASSSLLVTVTDASSTPILGATVNLTKSGFNDTKQTGERTFGETTWVGGTYTNQDGTVDANTPGQLSIVQIGGSTYPTSTNSWLVSNTLDFGTANVTLHQLSFNPAAQPNNTTLQIQIATSNSTAGPWTYVGPNGTASTYYTVNAPINAVNNGQRYLRYKVFLNTIDQTATPTLADINITFESDCIPEGQAFWAGIPTGAYSATVSKSGYTTATSTISVGSGWQEAKVVLP